MTTLAPTPSHSHATDDEPLLAVACPTCHGALAAPRAAAGTPARCPLCHEAFALPLPPRQKPATAAPTSDGVGEEPLRPLRADKATRRARRNLVMLFSGVVILLTIVLLFGTRRPKRRH